MAKVILKNLILPEHDLEQLMRSNNTGRRTATFIVSCLAVWWSHSATTSKSRANPSFGLGEFIAELQRPGASDGNLFGQSAAVDGHWAAVGSQTPDFRVAPSNVYAFDLSDPQNIVRRTFVNPAVQNGSSNKFGQSVAVRDSLLFVGDPEPQSRAPGVVHVYDLTSASNTPLLSIHAFDSADHNSFGESIAVDGNRLVVGAPDRSAVYVLDISDLNSIQQRKVVPDPFSSGGSFGQDVDVDGNFLIVGAESDGARGAIYLFDVTDPLHILRKKVVPSTADATDVFGRDVALSGRKALIAATGVLGPDPEPGTGVAYLIDFTNWDAISQIAFTASDTVTGDSFGGSSDVDLAGNLAVIGAKNEDDAGLSTGAVYFFDVSDPQHIQQLKKIHAPAPLTDDRFGNVLATDGTFLISASTRGTASGAQDPGRAYLFSIPEPSTWVLVAAMLVVPGVRRFFPREASSLHKSSRHPRYSASG